MPNQPTDVASALNKVAQNVKGHPMFEKIVSTTARQRVANALDNMFKYSNIFEQLEAATHKPGASEVDWKAQVDAIIYAPMNDDAAQKLVALIELVDADAKYH